MNEIQTDIYSNILGAACPNMLSCDQVCQLLNISANTCYRLLKSKAFPYLRIGRKYLIPKAGIQQYIAQNIR